MSDRVTLHASGFVRDGKPTSVSITSYDADLEDVVPGVVAQIESQGHDVQWTRMRPLGDWWMVAADLDVTVKIDGREDSHMWHHFCYAGDRWTIAVPPTDVENRRTS